MPNVDDRQKLESVRTVVTRGCRYHLEKVFKENLKGGELYEFSCNWLTGMHFTPSKLSAPKIDRVDPNYAECDANDDYSSFFKKVLKENTSGRIIHYFSYSSLTGSNLRPIAIMSKKYERENELLPFDGYKKLFTMVVFENLKGGILHEYAVNKMSAELSPILPHQKPSPNTYDQKLSIIKGKLICHHFVKRSGFPFDTMAVLPFPLSPNGDDDENHRH